MMSHRIITSHHFSRHRLTPPRGCQPRALTTMRHLLRLQKITQSPIRFTQSPRPPTGHRPQPARKNGGSNLNGPKKGVEGVRNTEATAEGAAASDAAGEAAWTSAESASAPATPLTRDQATRLFTVAALPFVGFGVMDNFIMIVAGDSIDQAFGVTLGISTLAAAGLGNLLSDVVGLSAGDVIERWCFKLGFRDPPLSAAQLALPQVRRLKSAASVIGLSVGCLIGMLPLLFMTDRKAMYFDDKELSLYETCFQPFGVEPKDFFELMTHGKWCVADPSAVMVAAGRPFEAVILLHQGTASAYVGGTASPGDKVNLADRSKLYNYRGRGGPVTPPTSSLKRSITSMSNSTMSNLGLGNSSSSSSHHVAALAANHTTAAAAGATDSPASSPASSSAGSADASAGASASASAAAALARNNTGEVVRGSIIGGSALVDLRVLGVPYPNEVVATSQVQYVQWDIIELRDQMKRNKNVEAAVFSTLYLDLLEGHSSMKENEMARGDNNDNRAVDLSEFAVLVRAILADGKIHESERRLVREFMASKGLSSSDLRREAAANDWTEAEWLAGKKSNFEDEKEREIRERIKEIPNMLKKADIRSRVTSALNGPKAEDSGLAK